MSRIVRPKPSRKHSALAPAPLLPRHQLPQPYARLLTLGDKDDPAIYEETAMELRKGNLQEAMSRLLEMALDEGYYAYAPTPRYETTSADPRIWTRVHALRTLERFGPEAAFALEPLLSLLTVDDDWLREELPFYCAAIGEASLESLAKILMDPNADPEARGTAAECIEEVGEQHIALRSRAVDLLTSVLNEEREDPTLVAYAIGELLNLNAMESLPLIEQAFAEDRVDLNFIQMPEVQEHFGLPVTAAYIEPWKDREGEDDAYLDEEEFEEGNDAERPEPFLLSLSETPQESEPRLPYTAPEKIGRNEPCPCGSGKKYKKCCGTA